MDYPSHCSAATKPGILIISQKLKIKGSSLNGDSNCTLALGFSKIYWLSMEHSLRSYNCDLTEKKWKMSLEWQQQVKNENTHFRDHQSWVKIFWPFLDTFGKNFQIIIIRKKILQSLFKVDPKDQNFKTISLWPSKCNKEDEEEEERKREWERERKPLQLSP